MPSSFSAPSSPNRLVRKTPPQSDPVSWVQIKLFVGRQEKRRMDQVTVEPDSSWFRVSIAIQTLRSFGLQPDGGRH